MSEFGSGVVVCLVKFSEHLNNSMFERASVALWYLHASNDRREADMIEAARYPRGDAARRQGLINSVVLGREELTDEMAVSAFTLWANGASDHFYDLQRDVAPQKLCELADFMLDLGHGDGLMGSWPLSAQETYDNIWRLWKEATLETDKAYTATPDWGEW